MTDLERIRALCQSFVEEAEHQVSRVGEAGAHDDLLRADSCRLVMIAIDACPPLTAVARVPQRIRDGLDRYTHHGIETGGFLRAVLSGDLFTAFERADDETLAALPAIIAYIIETMHPGIYGSPEAVSRWIGKVRA